MFLGSKGLIFMRPISLIKTRLGLLPFVISNELLVNFERESHEKFVQISFEKIPKTSKIDKFNTEESDLYETDFISKKPFRVLTLRDFLTNFSQKSHEKVRSNLV